MTALAFTVKHTHECTQAWLHEDGSDLFQRSSFFVQPSFKAKVRGSLTVQHGCMACFADFATRSATRCSSCGWPSSRLCVPSSVSFSPPGVFCLLMVAHNSQQYSCTNIVFFLHCCFLFFFLSMSTTSAKRIEKKNREQYVKWVAGPFCRELVKNTRNCNAELQEILPLIGVQLSCHVFLSYLVVWLHVQHCSCRISV